jgi:hypothetical protein
MPRVVRALTHTGPATLLRSWPVIGTCLVALAQVLRYGPVSR